MKGQLPFFIAAALSLANIALLVAAGTSRTGGSFIYPLDDPYIHLAIARHIAFDGVYGVTKYATTTAASSIAWPLLLAALMKVIGPRAIVALAVNVVASVGLVWVVTSAFAREAPGASASMRTAWTVAVVALVPLATLALFGMEHVLHAALTIAFVIEAARVVADEDKRASKLLAIAFALVVARYEGLFPVGLVVVALALRRRFARAAALLAVAGLPVVLFGAWSIAHGALFLPNSIVLKRQAFSLARASDILGLAGGKLIDEASSTAYLLALVFGLLFLLVREVAGGWRWTKNAVRLSVALGTTAAHVELTSHNWFYRYEAYVIALDVTVIALALLDLMPSFTAAYRALRRAPMAAVGAVIAAVVAVSPLGRRAFDAEANTPTGCRNVYEQQVQSARFLARYFPNDPVAINDIGAVAFFGDEPIVDLVGLADQRVARAKKLQFDVKLTPDEVGALASAAPVALVYDDWVAHPATWVNVGVLRIDRARSVASPQVSIYATSGASVPRVIGALRDFEPSLPQTVRREGRFAERPPRAASAPFEADAGDVLSIEIRGGEDRVTIAPVAPDGTIALAGVGEIRVRGLGLDAIGREVRARIGAGAEASVRLVAMRQPTYIVAGNVGRPGAHVLEPSETLARALAIAALPNDGADPYVWRERAGTFERVAADPRADRADAAILLQAGDIVVVP
jgi:hypothetical protein